MKLVSASRRTDIPAFYAAWFMNRIRWGYCHWIDPFGRRVHRVMLTPEECAGIVFWTRYPAPLLGGLGNLRARGFRFYFHVSINGYGKPLEARNPNLTNALRAFRALSDKISPALTLWRYDPILLSEGTPVEYHLRNFSSLARELAGYTGRCYFSFADFYGKTRRNLGQAGVQFVEPDLEAKLSLVRELKSIAEAHGIALYSCCEDAVLAAGVRKAHCVDLELLRSDLVLKPCPTRKQCGCVESVDIGAYDTCGFDCVYCYATNSWEAARERARRHDPNDPALWRPTGPGTGL
ncbi:MAG: DUF1848 domain-containing protein [Bryobacteraceae bacterium]